MSEQKYSKRPPLPLVLTGNDLIGGHVVYFDGAGWSGRIEDAAVAEDDAGAEALQAALGSSRARVVEPYLATVALTAERPVPTHYREKIRVAGPTFANPGALDVPL